MTTLNIKIVGIEGDSVLVKYASENSLKSIDDYDAIAYQPLTMGCTTIEEFIEFIKPGLRAQVELRDKAESVPKDFDFSSWDGHESSHEVGIMAQLQPSQVVVYEDEVIL